MHFLTCIRYITEQIKVSERIRCILKIKLKVQHFKIYDMTHSAPLVCLGARYYVENVLILIPYSLIYFVIFMLSLYGTEEITAALISCIRSITLRLRWICKIKVRKKGYSEIRFCI